MATSSYTLYHRYNVKLGRFHQILIFGLENHLDNGSLCLIPSAGLFQCMKKFYIVRLLYKTCRTSRQTGQILNLTVCTGWTQALPAGVKGFRASESTLVSAFHSFPGLLSENISLYYILKRLNGLGATCIYYLPSPCFPLLDYWVAKQKLNDCFESFVIVRTIFLV